MLRLVSIHVVDIPSALHTTLRRCPNDCTASVASVQCGNGIPNGRGCEGSSAHVSKPRSTSSFWSHAGAWAPRRRAARPRARARRAAAARARRRRRRLLLAGDVGGRLPALDGERLEDGAVEGGGRRGGGTRRRRLRRAAGAPSPPSRARRAAGAHPPDGAHRLARRRVMALKEEERRKGTRRKKVAYFPPGWTMHRPSPRPPVPQPCATSSARRTRVRLSHSSRAAVAKASSSDSSRRPPKSHSWPARLPETMSCIRKRVSVAYDSSHGIETYGTTPAARSSIPASVCPTAFAGVRVVGTRSSAEAPTPLSHIIFCDRR